MTMAWHSVRHSDSDIGYRRVGKMLTIDSDIHTSNNNNKRRGGRMMYSTTVQQYNSTTEQQYNVGLARQVCYR